MNAKPIIFSTMMVRAILAGRKTQTRRVIKPQPTLENMPITESVNEKGDRYHAKAKCKPGDILWVRETWARLHDQNGEEIIEYFANYADCPTTIDDAEGNSIKWRPSTCPAPPPGYSCVLPMCERNGCRRLMPPAQKKKAAKPCLVTV